MDEKNINRPTYVVGAGAIAGGGADVMGETAAALAAGSIIFKTLGRLCSRRPMTMFQQQI